MRYTAKDVNAIVAMVKKGDNMPAQGIQERLEKWTTLVWEDAGTVKGVAGYQKEGEGEFNVKVYVDPSFRQAGIGSNLCSAALTALPRWRQRPHHHNNGPPR